jgi:hypothetical protein
MDSVNPADGLDRRILDTDVAHSIPNTTSATANRNLETLNP